MVGSNLTRYDLDQSWLVFDTETCKPSLNLVFARSWQLSYATATLRDGIKSIHTHLIRWPGMVITEDNPSFKHFDRARYEKEAKDPKVVWDEFAPLLYSGKYRAMGHNILAYDSCILSVWRRAMGMKPDHSWIYNPPLLDTLCISKAYKSQWVPNLTSPEDFVAWQYQCYNTRLAKGVKTRLGVMCEEFGIEYDQNKAHEAQYDIERNWLVGKELIWKVEC